MEDILNDYIHQNVYASVGRRWLGAAIDWVIYIVLYYFLLYAFGQFNYQGPDTDYGFQILTVFFCICGSWFALFPVIEAINNGQTIGKAIVGVRVVTISGRRANFGVTLVRHLFDWVDYFPIVGMVGLIVAANTDNKQRVGDLVASTIVVNTR